MNIREIRQQLENERKRLTIELELNSAPDLNEDRTISPFNKRMEAASQRSDFEQKLALTSRMKQQVSDIEHALAKIDQGTYGFCDDCGKSIAIERLKVIPQANLCLACKAKQHRSLLKSYVR